MACSNFSRTCKAMPTFKDLPNITDVRFIEDPTGYTMLWQGDEYDVILCVEYTNAADPPPGGLNYYVKIPAGTTSWHVPIDLPAVVFIQWRQEADYMMSEWGNRRLLFTENLGDLFVLHREVPVVHDGELVVHTRTERYLITNGIAYDFIITQGGENISL